MTTVYLTEEVPVNDYSHIMDSVLLSLRKELRSDLNQISQIEWNDEARVTMCNVKEHIDALDLRKKLNIADNNKAR